MAARSDEMMFVPVDSNTAVIQSFISSIERNILADPILVLRYEMLYSSKRCFLFNRKNKYEVCSCFDACLIKRSYRSQERLDVASVIAYAGRVHFSIANLCLDLQAFLKNGVEMRIKDDGFCAAGAFPYCDQIALGVVIDLIELA